MDEKLRKSLTAIICDTVECTEPLDCDMAITCPYVIDGLPQIEQAFRDNGWVEQPDERIAKMLQSGDRGRLWHGQRFLDWDTISHEWVVMDSQGNKGLGCSLYVGSDLDKALDVLEGEGKC